jgi:hypothetical protein
MGSLCSFQCKPLQLQTPLLKSGRIEQQSATDVVQTVHPNCDDVPVVPCPVVGDPAGQDFGAAGPLVESVVDVSSFAGQFVPLIGDVPHARSAVVKPVVEVPAGKGLSAVHPFAQYAGVVLSAQCPAVKPVVEVPAGKGFSAVCPFAQYAGAVQSVQCPVVKPVVEVPTRKGFAAAHLCVQYVATVPSLQCSVAKPVVGVPANQGFACHSHASSVGVVPSVQSSVVEPVAQRSLLKVKLTDRCCHCRLTVLRQNLKIRKLQRQVSDANSLQNAISWKRYFDGVCCHASCKFDFLP